MAWTALIWNNSQKIEVGNEHLKIKKVIDKKTQLQDFLESEINHQFNNSMIMKVMLILC